MLVCVKNENFNICWEMLETRIKHKQEKRIESSKCLSGICYVPIIKALVDYDGKFLFYGQNHSRIQTVQAGVSRFKEKEIERCWLWLREKYLAKTSYISHHSPDI